MVDKEDLLKGDSSQVNNVGTSNRGRWRMVDAIRPFIRDAFKEIEENNEEIKSLKKKVIEEFYGK